MNTLTKSYKSYAIFVALTLALMLLGLYFYTYRSLETTIAIPFARADRVFIDIENELIKDHIQKSIEEHGQYEITEDLNIADIVINNEKNENSSLIYQEPLVVVVSPRTTVENINLNQLSDVLSQKFQNYEQIVTGKSYIPNLPDNIDITDEDLIILNNHAEVMEYIIPKPNALGLIPLSNLDVSILPLRVDEISVFDSPGEYPLQYSIYANGKKDQDINDFIDIIRPISENKAITSILAVGDIMMGRYVGVKISRSGDNAHSFQYVSDYLKKPDITFAQLETPIAPTALTSEGMILIAQPNTVDGLIESGIDIVSISGNHFGDALRDGMEDTFNTLEKNNILYIGAGRDEEKAFDYQIIEKNNTKIGFISYVNIMPSSYGAKGDIAGSAWVDFDSEYDLAKVQKSIKIAKENCDILLVGFHWGTEYTSHPTANQIKFAHAAIDSGADIVIGTHPHVVQADEIYQGKYIIYSLGNFIMDQMWSVETTEGVLMPIYIQNNKIISIDLVPTKIIDYSQVKIISKEEGSQILHRILDAGHNLTN